MYRNNNMTGILKILVACHKPGPAYRDEVHTPVHAGRSVSAYKSEMADMAGDDTGENISSKNPYYSEMTVQYWAWKNLHDVEYVGFCHYRRFFNLDITDGFIGSVMKDYDVIMPKVVFGHILERDIAGYVSIEDITIFLTVLKRMHPEYEQTVIDYLWNSTMYPKNMLICRKAVFDRYAEWMFGILSECEKYIKLSPYPRARRVYGYLAEYFMPVFFLHNHYQIYSTQYVDQPGKKNVYRASNRIKTLIKKAVIRLTRPIIGKPLSFEDYYLPEVILSLEQLQEE